MARKKEEWISAQEAAQILSANTDHPISDAYVRMLARTNKITVRERNGRENEYLKSDVEAYHVRPKHTPRVRPRPRTSKQEATGERAA